MHLKYVHTRKPSCQFNTTIYASNKTNLFKFLNVSLPEVVPVSCAVSGT